MAGLNWDPSNWLQSPGLELLPLYYLSLPPLSLLIHQNADDREIISLTFLKRAVCPGLQQGTDLGSNPEYAIFPKKTALFSGTVQLAQLKWRPKPNSPLQGVRDQSVHLFIWQNFLTPNRCQAQCYWAKGRVVSMTDVSSLSLGFKTQYREADGSQISEKLNMW